MLDELSVEYVPQIGFLTALNKRFCDLAPPDFSFAFSQVSHVFNSWLTPPREVCVVILRNILHGFIYKYR